jgi:hypothetical protein
MNMDEIDLINYNLLKSRSAQEEEMYVVNTYLN